MFALFGRKPTRKALNQAIYNVVNNYAVVGVLEEIKDFYWALEQLMPQFFSGLLDIYNDSMYEDYDVCLKNELLFLYVSLYGRVLVVFLTS